MCESYESGTKALKRSAFFIARKGKQMIDYKSQTKPREIAPDGAAVYCAFDELVPIQDLKPNPRNPNTHGDSQIKLLGDIIASTGWRQPITVSKRSGLIVKGHGRRLAALFKGLKYAPVDFQDYASEAEEHADRVADNRIAELAEMNEEKLIKMVQDLGQDIPVELSGFTEEGLKDLLGDDEADTEDDAADKEVEDDEVRITKTGDLWHLGRHRLLCGSATSDDDIKRLMNNEIAQMVHTDPPYGVSYESISGKFNQIKNDNVTDDDLMLKILIPAFKNYVKYTEDTAAFYIWYASRAHREFEDAMTAAGLCSKQQIIWSKNQFVLGRSDYQWAHEPCLYSCKAGYRPKFYGDRSEWTVWKVSVRKENEISTTLSGGVTIIDGKGGKLFALGATPKGKKTRVIRIKEGSSVFLQNDSAQSTIWEVTKDVKIKHPTQKPVELPMRAMMNSSKEGDLVLDFFGGSGSTLLAAEKMNRRCYSTELDPKYCDLIVKRYIELTNDTAITVERDGKEIKWSELQETTVE